jgi:sugar phosphate permease
MTYKTFVSSRSQVTAALMIGVYLTIASRSHFNQMLVDATGGRHQVYSAMNVVYQVAYAAIQVPASMCADHMDPVPALAIVPLMLALTSAVAPFVLWYVDWTASAPLPISSIVAIGALFAVNGASLGAWWPFMNVMVSNWAPPDRLAVMYGTINTGLPGGIALGNAVCGFAYSVHETTFRYSFFVVSVSTYHVIIKYTLRPSPRVPVTIPPTDSTVPRGIFTVSGSRSPCPVS